MSQGGRSQGPVPGFLSREPWDAWSYRRAYPAGGWVVVQLPPGLMEGWEGPPSFPLQLPLYDPPGLDPDSARVFVPEYVQRAASAVYFYLPTDPSIPWPSPARYTNWRWGCALQALLALAREGWPPEALLVLERVPGALGELLEALPGYSPERVLQCGRSYTRNATASPRVPFSSAEHPSRLTRKS